MKKIIDFARQEPISFIAAGCLSVVMATVFWVCASGLVYLVRSGS